ncbi:MAG TPA: NAD(P)/FAD-dependent oxidoreductase [Bryobacteraceae bacterium]|nr:NAD(P)/FAD-dependent oxidoreductase [Bryobacteraceae bacterium]
MVGGGNSAGQAALHFAQYANKVTMLLRGDRLAATLSQYLVDKITSAGNIEVLTRAQVTAVERGVSMEGIRIRHGPSHTQRTVGTRWLFVCIGGLPHTEWAEDTAIVRDEAGYLVTGPDLLTGSRWPACWPLERAPFFLETSVPGSFAAGDVRHGSVKRVASAVGEGAMAVQFVHRHLEANHRKLPTQARPKHALNVERCLVLIGRCAVACRRT